MADPDEGEDLDVDIDSQLRGLFEQAEQDIAAAARADGPATREKAAPASGENAPPNGALIEVVGSTPIEVELTARPHAEPAAAAAKNEPAGATPVQVADVGKLIGDLRALLEQKSGVNQRMFDALHEELRGYKDGFLLESMHRPVIRDLISLYDEVAEIRRQMAEALGECTVGSGSGLVPPPLMDSLKTLEANTEHNLEFILEVLARLQVIPMPNGEGKLDKRMQRAVSVEITDNPEEDTALVRSVKRGFLWKERVVRPEEVVTKKWKEPSSQE